MKDYSTAGVYSNYHVPTAKVEEDSRPAMRFFILEDDGYRSPRWYVDDARWRLCVGRSSWVRRPRAQS